MLTAIPKWRFSAMTKPLPGFESEEIETSDDF
jgi:hypothetical protein